MGDVFQGGRAGQGDPMSVLERAEETGGGEPS